METAPRPIESSVRVVIADDQDLARAGMIALLATFPDMRVLAEARDGYEAVVLAQRLRPDVVVLDARMPGVDGVQATRMIRDLPYTAGIVMLTVHAGLEREALRAGVDGFLVKGCAAEDLVGAIRAASRAGRGTRSS